MIIWTGWGLSVVIIGFIALIAAFMIGDALMSEFAMAYGPAQAAGVVIGGGLATLSLVLITRWRERGESRTFVDEQTGERFEVRPSAGSLFFIPTRYWSWIMLALTAFLTYAMFDATPPNP